jgi:hypothetical protein
VITKTPAGKNCHKRRTDYQNSGRQKLPQAAHCKFPHPAGKNLGIATSGTQSLLTKTPAGKKLGTATSGTLCLPKLRQAKNSALPQAAHCDYQNSGKQKLPQAAHCEFSHPNLLPQAAHCDYQNCSRQKTRHIVITKTPAGKNCHKRHTVNFHIRQAKTSALP